MYICIYCHTVFFPRPVSSRLVPSRFSPFFHPSLAFENRSRGESVRRIPTTYDTIVHQRDSSRFRFNRIQQNGKRRERPLPSLYRSTKFLRHPSSRAIRSSSPNAIVCAIFQYLFARFFFLPLPFFLSTFSLFPPIEEVIERFDVRRQNHRSKREDRLIRLVDRVIVRGSFSLSWSPSISFFPKLGLSFETTKQMVKQGSNCFDECKTFPLLVCILAVSFLFLVEEVGWIDRSFCLSLSLSLSACNANPSANPSLPRQ